MNYTLIPFIIIITVITIITIIILYLWYLDFNEYYNSFKNYNIISTWNSKDCIENNKNDPLNQCFTNIIKTLGDIEIKNNNIMFTSEYYSYVMISNIVINNQPKKWNNGDIFRLSWDIILYKMDDRDGSKPLDKVIFIFQSYVAEELTNNYGIFIKIKNINDKKKLFIYYNTTLSLSNDIIPVAEYDIVLNKKYNIEILGMLEKGSNNDINGAFMDVFINKKHIVKILNDFSVGSNTIPMWTAINNGPVDYIIKNIQYNDLKKK